MTKKIVLAICCAALLGFPAFSGDGDKAPACCAKKAGAAQTTQRMHCTLTGKDVDKCCCVERNGKLHCTLADKDVEKCCCVEAKAEQAKSAARR